MQPSVVYIGDAEKTFMKKVPKTDKVSCKKLWTALKEFLCLEKTTKHACGYIKLWFSQMFSCLPDLGNKHGLEFNWCSPNAIFVAETFFSLFFRLGRNTVKHRRETMLPQHCFRVCPQLWKGADLTSSCSHLKQTEFDFNTVSASITPPNWMCLYKKSNHTGIASQIENL